MHARALASRGLIARVLAALLVAGSAVALPDALVSQGAAAAGPTVTSVRAGTRVVQVNGQPFVATGYMYWPAGIPTQLGTTTWADPVQCENDARLLQGAGATLVRVYYEAEGPALIDNYRACATSFFNHGIGLLWLIQPPTANEKPVSLGTSPDAWAEHYKPWIQTAVNQLKDHPATYMWTIGNEGDGSVDGTCSTRDVLLGRAGGAVGIIDQLFTLTKSLDPNHLVGTSIGGCTDQLFATFNVPHLDFWGINNYRVPGSQAAYFASLTNTTSQAFDARPKIFTEFGEDRYSCSGGLVHGISCATPGSGENQSLQATWDRNAWRDIAANLATAANPNGAASGGTVFMYSDLWWYSLAAFNPASFATHDVWGSTPWPSDDNVQNTEWWGVSYAMFQGDAHTRATTLAFDALAAEWRSGVAQPTVSAFAITFAPDPATAGLTCLGRVTYTTAVAANTEVQVGNNGEVFNNGGDMIQDNTFFGPAGLDGAQVTSHSMTLGWGFAKGAPYKVVARSTVAANQMSATMQPAAVAANC